MINEIFKQVKGLKTIHQRKKPSSRFEVLLSKLLALALLILIVLASLFIIRSQYAGGFTKARLFLILPLIISIVILLWRGISPKWMLQWVKNY
jgi:hypothetical protein